MGPHKRGPWCPGEDACLLQLVQSQGAHNWVRISHLIRTRSPKQCRERFHQNLKPALNHEPISPEEGRLIEKLVGEMGKRWAEIARRLNGRSDNAVKNWWNGGMNRRRRLTHRRADSTKPAPRFDDRSEAMTFARPSATYQSAATRTTIISPPKRAVEPPLLSPSATSDVSRADSAEGAPSLVSDSASLYSTSPKYPESPAIELPRLAGAPVDSRRSSLSILHLGSNSFLSDSDAQLPSLAARYDSGGKMLERLEPQHSMMRKPALSLETSQAESQRLQYPSSGSSTSSSSCQLPSFRSFTHAVDSAIARDQRMKLSNLLV